MNKLEAEIVFYLAVMDIGELGNGGIRGKEVSEGFNDCDDTLDGWIVLKNMELNGILSKVGSYDKRYPHCDVFHINKKNIGHSYW